MKTSKLFSLFVIFFVAASCSKNADTHIVKVLPSEAFYSIELGESIGVNPSTTQSVNFNGQEFSHYLVIYRGKSFTESEADFNTFVFGTTFDPKDNMHLQVGGTSVFSSGNSNIVAYNFSGASKKIVIDGVATDDISEMPFTNVPFDFTINETVYQGFFPEPGTIKGQNTEVGINSLSLSENKTIYWEPTPDPNDKIRLFIFHNGTVNGAELLPSKGYILDDTGNFNLSSTILSGYQAQDEITIALFRDIFISSNQLLVRSIEEQRWAFVTVTN